MNDRYILSTGSLCRWADGLADRFRLLGPILQKRGQTVFKQVPDGGQLDLGYCRTMTSSRCFIYPAVQNLFTVDLATHTYTSADPGPRRTQLIFAIHPCDMHAIAVLDRTFLGAFTDFYYAKMHAETCTVVLNCNQACDKGFCPSMGTGPFVRLKEGFDVVMTFLGDEYLLEPGFGEAPFSFNSLDGGDNTFVHTIRVAGKLKYNICVLVAYG